MTTNYILLAGIAIVVILLLLLVRPILKMRRVVPTSEVHIVRRGSVTKIYGNPDKTTENSNQKLSGNSYYQFPQAIPYFGVSVTVMPLSIFPIEISEYAAYDKDRVPFMVDVTSFFRISDYEIAASRIGNISDLKTQLRSIVQGTVRSILAKDQLDNIMGERASYGEKFTQEVKEELKAWGVESVKNIELMDVRDSDGEEVIEQIMEKKKSEIAKDSRIKVAQNNQAAEEAEIDAQKAIDLRKQDKLKEVALRTSEVKEQTRKRDEEAEQNIQMAKKVTKEKELEVTRVEEITTQEIQKDKQIVVANTQKETKRISAEADQQAKEIEAQTQYNVGAKSADQKFYVGAKEADQEAYVKGKISEGDLEKARNDAEANLVGMTKNAEGIKAEGLAKADARKQMEEASIAGKVGLAQEIGSNEGYQKYLVEIRKIEAIEVVGKEQAVALQKSSIKILAGGGDVAEGISSIGDLFGAKGGFKLGQFVEALSATESGKNVLEKLGLEGSEEPVKPETGKIDKVNEAEGKTQKKK